MQYRLLKDILEYKKGTIVTIQHGYGHLGYMEYGWDIPEEIIIKNTEWFEPILSTCITGNNVLPSLI